MPCSQAGLGLRGRLEDARPSSEGAARFDWLRYLRGSEKVLQTPWGNDTEVPRGDVAAGAATGASGHTAPGCSCDFQRSQDRCWPVLLWIAFAVTGYFADQSVALYPYRILLGALLPDSGYRAIIRIARTESSWRFLMPWISRSSVWRLGLGLDQALMRIGQELKLSYPDLSDELSCMVSRWMPGRGGPIAPEPCQPTEVDDLKSLAAVLIQTDRFGTSVAQSLRVFAETMRTKRRQRAEERAAKMSYQDDPAARVLHFPRDFHRGSGSRASSRSASI